MFLFIILPQHLFPNFDINKFRVKLFVKIPNPIVTSISSPTFYPFCDIIRGIPLKIARHKFLVFLLYPIAITLTLKVY